jgi:O-antigen ligase
MNAVIFVRILAACLAAVVLVAGGLILIGIGDTRGAVKLVIVSGLVFLFVRPNSEQRAQFDQFQKQREPYTPPPRR